MDTAIKTRTVPISYRNFYHTLFFFFLETLLVCHVTLCKKGNVIWSPNDSDILQKVNMGQLLVILSPLDSIRVRYGQSM